MRKINFLGVLLLGTLTIQAQQKTVVSSTGEKISVNADASTTTKGIIQLGGDLKGNATVQTINDNVITNAKIAGPISVIKGGTGQTTFANGELLIGNSTGNTLTKTTLTGTPNQVNVTNGSGSIALSLPQSIATTSDVNFNSLTLNATGAIVPAITFKPNSYFSILEDNAYTQFLIPKASDNSSTYITYPKEGDFYVRNVDDLLTNNFSFKIDKLGAMTLRNASGNNSTPSAGDNSTRVATTAFVKNALSAGTGIYGGSGLLTENTVVAQGSNTLEFTTNANNGFSVDGTTFSIDALNNRVGIGTVNPNVANMVVENNGDAQIAITKTGVSSGWIGVSGSNLDNTNVFALASDTDILLKTGATYSASTPLQTGITSGKNRFRISNATGYIGVGVGILTPESLFHMNEFSDSFVTNRVTQLTIENKGVSTGFLGINDTQFTLAADGTTPIAFKTGATYPSGISTGEVKMQMDSNNPITMNRTTGMSNDKGTLVVNMTGATQGAIQINNNLTTGLSTSSSYVMTFYNDGFFRGGLYYFPINGNTPQLTGSSDYRLKEDLKDFDALNLVNRVPIYDFQWKEGKTRTFGAMAHELQAAIPDAVLGEKDAVNPDGTIKPQQVAYGVLTPIIFKAVQEVDKKIIELQDKNTALEQRVLELENAVKALLNKQ